LRNSADKSFALSVLSGFRVQVCSNGVLAGDFIISRKHTSGIDLVESVEKALDFFLLSLRDFNTTYERLRAKQLRRTTAHSLIIELAQAGAFSSSDILPVVREFEQNRHPEFREKNAWSLYQSCTEIMKTQSPARQVDGFKALNQVLVAELN
jgi:hypothetical protein